MLLQIKLSQLTHPFQTITFARLMASENSTTDFGPTSKPCK